MGCAESKQTGERSGDSGARQQDKPAAPAAPAAAAPAEEVESSVGSDFEEVDDDDDAPPPPPRTYRASTQLLGRGGSASVYAGICDQDRTPVAIKRVQVGTPAIQRALELEYATLRALPPHPCVVKVHHFAVEGDTGVIVLELVKGGTLRRLCRAAPQRRLHEAAIRVYMRDCLLGLQHLHNNGIVHRDLKSDNLLVAKKLPSAAAAVSSVEPFVKITDFGSAKETLHGGVCRTTVNVVGTVPYLAPEAVRGKFSEASDVWAFGITLLELAIPDQNVWAHLGVTDPFAMLLKIGALKPPHHRPHIPDTLSDAGRRVVEACLAYDPTERPSCSELLQLPYFNSVGSPAAAATTASCEAAMESLEDFAAAVV